MAIIHSTGVQQFSKPRSTVIDYTRTFRFGGITFRVRVHADSYKDQSYAVLERLDTEWTQLHRIAGDHPDVSAISVSGSADVGHNRTLLEQLDRTLTDLIQELYY